MENGILLVVFGEEYDTFAASCMQYSKKYIKTPVCVLTNLKNPSEKWEDLTDISFKYFDLAQDKNRQIKTTMNEHTPFKNTLYLDCDCILQKDGIEDIFDKIPENGLLLQVYSRVLLNRQIPGALYRKAFSIANICLPTVVYYGAFLGFKENKDTDLFFKLWNKYWMVNGYGREMPSLSCAVKNSKIHVKELSNNVFSWRINKEATIQHEYGGFLKNLVDCKEFRSFKPFDKR